MRTIFYILIFLFFKTLLNGQTIEKHVKVDTIIYSSITCKDCPIVMDTVVYKLLKCGLYIGSNNELAYRSQETYNKNFDERTRYIKWIWGADQNDKLNSGLKKMKSVVDTLSFRFLIDLYWADKNNIYGFTPMSDGGTIFINKLADKKSFRAFRTTEYAKDKKNVYYHNSIIKGANPKTFKIINHKDLSELACDKLYIFRFGEQLSDKQIKEWELENYGK